MRLKTLASIAPAALILALAILACSLGKSPPPVQVPPPVQTAVPGVVITAAAVDQGPTLVPVTLTPSIVHQAKPAELAVTGKTVYDVESVDTALEKRAPYGDSYDINRLERPFLQDMIYVPDLDLSTYTVGKDNDWYYVSVALVGRDPNDNIGINYAVELDTDHDGFGDYILWAHPPYGTEWDTIPVQIFQDTNHDTGGLSAEKSDAPLTGNGYDKLVFNGGVGDADPDLAWVRANKGLIGSVQFAFKRSWSGDVFMLGVLADAGLKDPGKLDYVDRFTLADAGSPVKGNKNYPLKALYSVDNVCRSAFGFKATGYEPQLCPSEPPPVRKPKPGVTPVGCQPPPGGCGLHSVWKPDPICQCEEVLY